MGARASRRRHEGRAIRKKRRVIKEQLLNLGAISAGFTALGKAAEHAVRAMGHAFIAFANGAAVVWDEREGGVTAPDNPFLICAILPGAGDARRAQGAAERVDATAVRMGIELEPWQRELAIASIVPVEGVEPQ